jgi:hypothetical protein
VSIGDEGVVLPSVLMFAQAGLSQVHSRSLTVRCRRRTYIAQCAIRFAAPFTASEATVPIKCPYRSAVIETEA